MTTTPQDPTGGLSDDEMATSATPEAGSVPGPADADGTDGGDADGTDGGDSDGTDGDSTDATDGDSTDADGTDG